MPPDFPTFDQLEDREKLRKYVAWVRDFLGHLVDEANENKFFYSRTLVQMRAAWREVQPEFDRLVVAVGDFDQAVLVSHGLGGFQLQFKLAVVRELLRAFRRPSPRGLRRLLTNRGGRFARQYRQGCRWWIGGQGDQRYDPKCH